MSEGSFEAKVYAKRENAAGIYLTLQINPADFTSDLATLRVGSALLIGWAEIINSKVEPIIVDPADFGGITDLMRGETVKPKERQPFDSLSLTKQAAIRCQDKDFQDYARVHDSEGAAEYIRLYCQVSSRSQIVPGTEAAKRWQDIESGFLRWRTDRQYAENRR